MTLAMYNTIIIFISFQVSKKVNEIANTIISAMSE